MILGGSAITSELDDGFIEEYVDRRYPGIRENRDLRAMSD
jgi:hypothetical protein